MEGESKEVKSPLPEVGIVTANELYRIYLNKDLEPGEGQKVRVLINMVVSLDGVINVPQEEGGKASQEGLSHSVDQKLMRVIRSHVDAIVNGSGTLKMSGSDSTIEGEKYPELAIKRKEAGKSENPIACVVTSDPDPVDFDGEVLGGQFFHDTTFHSILFVGEGASEEHLERIEKVVPQGKQFEVIRLPSDKNGRPDVKVLIDILHDKYGVRILLSEGGPLLNGSLFDAEVVTDLFLARSQTVDGMDKDRKGIVEVDKSRTRDNLIRLRPVSMFYESSSNMDYSHQQVES